MEIKRKSQSNFEKQNKLGYLTVSDYLEILLYQISSPTTRLQ